MPLVVAAAVVLVLFLLLLLLLLLVVVVVDDDCLFLFIVPMPTSMATQDSSGSEDEGRVASLAKPGPGHGSIQWCY